MKTIKLSLAAVLFAVAITAAAIERPTVKIVPVNKEKAIVSVTNENAALFEMSIYAADGEMIYYKQTNEQLKDVSKVFDFKNLEQGKYVFSLKINDTHVTNSFEVSEDGIKVGQKEINYDPYFSFKDGIIKLSYLNFDLDNLELLIYGRDGLVYEKALGNDFNVVKGLDLSKLEKGNYNIVLNSPDKEYSFNIVK